MHVADSSVTLDWLYIKRGRGPAEAAYERGPDFCASLVLYLRSFQARLSIRDVHGATLCGSHDERQPTSNKAEVQRLALTSIR